jgi:hypothetical protein
MTAPAGRGSKPCGASVGPAKPTLPCQRPGFLHERDLHEAYLAACHKLSERLTATTNYVAVALRLCETGSVSAATRRRHTEILEKAVGQINQANDEARQLRRLLSHGGIKAGPVYRICFLNEFARFNKVVRACQRAIIIRSARSRERAIEAAKKRFARLERVRDWRDHAKIIEVSIIEDDPSLRVSRR